ncbi:Bax inhibitor-1/YccA family protein [Rhodoligotrophos defluvii]|uniref:Bax inhibitor-1/YccA family protein n=1 Tax=Rhodoligotrophos defluvii TaxID=2561934 RepID=UPI0010C9429B|nr:Bax inhibitor-1/YccA family protein [Rhodoligotrophos defluvii]
MADLNNRGYARPGVAGTTFAIDEGLRSYMLRVYNYMTIGLLITGFAALAVYALSVTSVESEAVARAGDVLLTQVGYTLFVSPLKWVVIFAPLAMVFFLSFRLNAMSVGGAQLAFWAFALLMGISLSSIFLVYTHGSIARVFFITAAAFGALSLWGYTTKRDLSPWGSFLIMGLIGIIIASVVNLFLASPGLEFVVSVLGVLIFAGLTAYDTQSIKEMYFEGDGAEVAGRKAILGALRLYLDFINLFLMLLRLFGNRQ